MEREYGAHGNERLIRVMVGSAILEGNLGIPAGARGMVLFAHGSGSSRHSPRNRYVAGVLQAGGLATLLIDLLTPDEERLDMRTPHLRFDINLLTNRLASAMTWLVQQPTTHDLRIGCFGASTGGAAALVAAAQYPHQIVAVVSRGGRLDLAGPALTRVRAPTLLIVGGNDIPLIRVNEDALPHLSTKSRLEIIPGATHLFEESGALEQVAYLARSWFNRYIPVPS